MTLKYGRSRGKNTMREGRIERNSLNLKAKTCILRFLAYIRRRFQSECWMGPNNELRK